MLTHVMVGTNNLEQAIQFYNAALGTLGIPAQDPAAERAFYSTGEGPAFGVAKPANGESACYANGGTIGFQAKDKDQVDAWHAAGMANGGSDEGAPGPRPYMPGAYAAYMRDPDGNKICAFCMLPDA